MARAIWNGTISFGLVSVPVRLLTAVRDRSIRLNLLTPDGSCRLRQKLYCPDTGEEFDFSEAARGYEIAPEQYVLINQDEIARLRPEAGRTIEIAQFAELDEIDPIYFDRTYYLAPGEGGERAYYLLARAMDQRGRVAIARFIMRDREYLATIRAKEGHLILHTMYYEDEIVPLSSLGAASKESLPTVTEQRTAQQLIGVLTSRFDPGDYHDEFREQLQQVIDAKAEGIEIAPPPEPEPEAPPVYNLMEALKKSLAQTGKIADEGSKKEAPRRRRKSA